MSELKVHLYQASLILAILAGWDNEYNFAELYFCPSPFYTRVFASLL